MMMPVTAPIKPIMPLKIETMFFREIFTLNLIPLPPTFFWFSLKDIKDSSRRIDAVAAKMRRLNISQEDNNRSSTGSQLLSSPLKLPEDLPSVEAVRMRAHRLGLNVVDHPPSSINNN